MNTLMWYTVPEWNMSIHCSAKAGSQTLLKAILKHYRITDPGFGRRRAEIHYRFPWMASEIPPPHYRAVQFVRGPVQRFKSLWKDKVRGHGQGIPSHLWDSSPDELLDNVEKHLYENVHWCPQFVVQPYADDIVQLESFNRYCPVEVEPGNTTEGDVPDFNVKRLRRLYDLDDRLYRLYAQT